MLKKGFLCTVLALLTQLNGFSQAAFSDHYADGMAVAQVEKGVEARTFFIDHAPDGVLKTECDKVYDPSAPCNKGMGNQSFKDFITFYNDFPVKRRSYLYSNYSNADTPSAMERIFRMTIPYYEQNRIVPIQPREETTVNGVKNYATFFAVDAHRVGYKAVVSFPDHYMIAILGFIRFDDLWYLTESHVGFLDYKQ